MFYVTWALDAYIDICLELYKTWYHDLSTEQYYYSNACSSMLSY